MSFQIFTAKKRNSEKIHKLESNLYFYILNPNDFQEFNSTIVEIFKSKNNFKIFLIILDVTSKKRPMKNYSLESVRDFYLKLREKNKINNNNSIEILKFSYEKDSIEDFKSFQRKYPPDLIFRRNFPSKNLVWKLPEEKKKTILFLWETKECENYKDDYVLAVCRYEHMVKGIKQTSIECFNNLRYPALDHEYQIDEEIVNFYKSKKNICFIPETWARNKKEKETLVKELKVYLEFIKSQDINVVWKSREKYSQDDQQYSLIESLESNFDLILNRDLNYPSSLQFLMLKSNFCILLNTTSVFHDAFNLNSNIYHYVQSDYNNSYISRLKSIHRKDLENVNTIKNILDENLKIKINSIKKIESNSCKRLLEKIIFLLQIKFQK